MASRRDRSAPSPCRRATPFCPTVAGGNLPRAVALATALQFIGQLIGIAAASQADRIGALALLLAQAAFVLAGATAVWRLPEPPPHPPTKHPSFWRSIGGGIAEAARSEQMWPVLLLNFGIGVFYVGPFMAVLPIVVRDIYHGGAAEIAYVESGLLGRHHRCRLRLRGPGAPVLAARPSGGRRRVGRRRDPALHGAAAAVPRAQRALLRLGAGRRNHPDPGAHHPADRGAAHAPCAADVAVPARPGRRRSDRRLRGGLFLRRRSDSSSPWCCRPWRWPCSYPWC